MISVQEARQLILQHGTHSKTALLPLAEANGCILSADVFALNDAPPFDQSAMNGYAQNKAQKKNSFSHKK